jgi:hypothetical protein
VLRVLVCTAILLAFLALPRTPVLLIIRLHPQPATHGAGALTIIPEPECPTGGSGFTERRQSHQLHASELAGHTVGGLADGLLFRHGCATESHTRATATF